jgi:hypothetical protein
VTALRCFGMPVSTPHHVFEGSAEAVLAMAKNTRRSVARNIVAPFLLSGTKAILLLLVAREAKSNSSLLQMKARNPLPILAHRLKAAEFFTEETP